MYAALRSTLDRHVSVCIHRCIHTCMQVSMNSALVCMHVCLCIMIYTVYTHTCHALIIMAGAPYTYDTALSRVS